MSSDQDNSVIYSGFISGILLSYDYNENKLTRMDLNKYFEGKPFKIKILDLKGVDICLEDKDFISDIAFTEADREFIKRLVSVEHKSNNKWSKEKLKAVNYDDEVNWALTYRLRGYDVEFDVTPMDTVDNYMVRLVRFVFGKHEATTRYTSSFSDREEDFKDYLNNNSCCWQYLRDQDDDESFETQSDEELSENDPDYFDYDERPVSRGKYDPDHLVVMSSNLLPVRSPYCSTNDWVYIEHSEVSRFSGPINVVKKTFKDSVVLELSFNDGKLFGVLLELSACSSPNLKDYQLHSDEGAYNAGVNKYDWGLVLIGEQNSGVMYYGTAAYDDILIPDYFLVDFTPLTSSW